MESKYAIFTLLRGETTDEVYVCSFNKLFETLIHSLK